jgi:hypothetical protein
MKRCGLLAIHVARPGMCTAEFAKELSRLRQLAPPYAKLAAIVIGLSHAAVAAYIKQ